MSQSLNSVLSCFACSSGLKKEIQYLKSFRLQFTVSLCDPYTGHCPDFTATFVTLSDQTLDGPDTLISDFFKEDMGLRNNDIQHVFEDAINEMYGLDFSNSPLNDQNEYFF